MILFKVATRLLAFVTKELLETIRRPGAILSLILGPFIILAVFGIGFSGVRRPLDTIVVVPTQSGLPQDASEYQKFSGAGVNIVAVTSDEAGARQLLAQQKVDLVVVAPSNIVENFKAGKQSTLDVEYNVTDPVESNYAGILAERLSNEVNQEIIRQAAQQSEQQAATYGVQGTPIPPNVVAQPTVTQLHNLSPTGPGVILFFGPAVVALILQHMAVTLTALSLVRERMSGVMELFRVAPVSALEILLGKYVAFGILNAIIAAVVMGLLIAVFHVPVLGSVVAIVTVLALLGFASLGLGLFISVVSDSGAPGGAAVTARPPRVGVLQRLRHQHRRVHSSGADRRLRDPCHARHPAAPGLPPPGHQRRDMGARRPRRNGRHPVRAHLARDASVARARVTRA